MSLGKRLFIGEAADAACSTDSVQPFGADSAYSSNVALYQLDGNANDTVGNYNGTAYNVTYSTGQFGNAAVFNGSSSYIFNSNRTSTQTTTITLSAWVNTTDTTSSMQILQTESLWLRANQVWRIDNANGTGAYRRYEFTQSTIATGNWVHVCVVRDGNSVTLYVNNSAVSFSSDTTSSNSGVYDGISIGARNRSSDSNKASFFDGKIDQVRIYDKALSSDEVSILYNETTSTASDTNVLGEGSGVALYSLDYDASDAGGNYDGRVSHPNYGVLPSFGVDGQINWGARFYGSPTESHFSTGITINDLSMTNTSFSCWVNFTATSGTIMDNGGAVSYRTGLVLETASGYIVWQQANGTNGQATAITSASNSYNDGNWHHVVGTIDSNRVMKLYIDGNVESSTPTANVENHSHPDFELVVGARAGFFTNYYEGLLDQVRIFQKALSQNEVDTLHAETACVYTSTTDTVDYQGTNLAYYKLDNTAEDETGNYDGTETDITYEFGRYGQAASFNGSSSKIDLGNNFNLTQGTGFSISMWVKPNSLSSTYSLLSKDNSSSRNWTLSSFSGSLANPRFFIKSTTGKQADQQFTESLSVGTWSHLVVTWSGGLADTTIKLYFDGDLQPDNSTATSETLDNVATNTQSTLIGDSANYNNHFDGLIDQVRIYNSELDATAVENLYNEKPEADTSNFKTVLYDGNGGTQYVSNVGFEPDLVWVKNRDSTHSHQIFDSIRGVGKQLIPNTNLGELTDANSLTSFDINGFTLGSNIGINGNNELHVAWCWKGGGDSVSNTVGTLTSQVSANPDAGFSIVKWTNNGALRTVGHGLNSTPELIIFKRTDTAQNWYVETDAIDDSYDYLVLNDTAAKVDGSGAWSTRATSTTITSFTSTNNSQYIAYCFHSVAGYSKIGSYEGNGTTTNVDLGFNPSWIMIKNADAGSTYWNIVDTRRDTDTTLNLYLQANVSGAESSATICSLITDGFSVTGSATYNNSNGDTFLYVAFK